MMDVHALQTTSWFSELCALVERELLRLRRRQNDLRPALEAERERLEAQIRGWTQSLGKPDLDSAVRAAVEESLRGAFERQREIEATLAEREAADRIVEGALDPRQVADRLDHLADVLALNNPSLGNLELSLYIDTITCDFGGRVVLRTCRLGALTDAMELLRTGDPPPAPEPDDSDDGQPGRVRPRRRARLRVDDADNGGRDLQGLADWAADPHRFDGLPARWFQEEVFQVPVKKSWAERHAADVARRRIGGMTVAALAAHFGRSVPTIRASLRHAAALAEFAGRLPGKQPRARWHEDEQQVRLVTVLKGEGLSVPEIAHRCGKSEPTIRKALANAARRPQASC